MTWLAAALMLAGGSVTARAGISVGYKPTNMTEQQFYEMAVQDAERDLIRKKRVGEVRYQARQARTADIIRAMKAQSEMHRNVIFSQKAAPTPTAAPALQGPDFMGWLLWFLVAVVSSVIGWHYFKNRGKQGGMELDFGFAAIRREFTPKVAKTSTLSSGGSVGNSMTPSLKPTHTPNRGNAPAVAVCGSQNCYSCGKQTAAVRLEKINFCGETFSMCPSCADQHRIAWATN